MLPTVDDPARVIVGHSLASLKRLPAGCVSMCATSPPYYGLRAYNTDPQTWGDPGGCDHDWDTKRFYREGGNAAGSHHAFHEAGPENAKRLKEARWRNNTTCRKCGAWRGELGLEPTLEMFIAHLVELFREVRRVLHPAGTLWLNVGDSYTSGGRSSRDPGQSKLHPAFTGEHNGATAWRPADPAGMKPKDLMGVPWAIAFALRADGWYLRSGLPWLKRNAMPESITDRPANALEYVFLFSKAERYFYDHTVIRLAASQPEGTPVLTGQHKRAVLQALDSSTLGTNQGPTTRNRRNTDWFFDSWQGLYSDPAGLPLAFVVNPVPSDLGHFAMWPPELVRPMILAGTSAKGNCPACGTPWRRVTSKERKPTRPGRDTKIDYAEAESRARGRTGNGMVSGNRDPQRHCTTMTTTGWEPGCKCPPAEPVPATVLDCFCGTGTTLKVAVELKRLGLGLELNPEYAGFAEQRLAEPLGVGGLFPPTAPVVATLFPDPA